MSFRELFQEESFFLKKIMFFKYPECSNRDFQTLNDLLLVILIFDLN